LAEKGARDESMLPKAWKAMLGPADYVPVVVRSVERVHDVTWTMGPSIHEHYEMVYMKSGKAVFDIEGDQVEIGPNDMIIIKPNKRHMFAVRSKECDFFVLNFGFTDSRDKSISEVSLGEFIDFLEGRGAGPYLFLKVNQKNDIISVVERVVNEGDNDDIGGGFMSRLLVMELFVLISRALKREWENSLRKMGYKRNELIRSAVGYIDNNYERNISLKDISRFVFLSPSYFTRAFKEETGMSPINYLLRRRIGRASELLLTTDRKVSDIALAVGFSNQQRFNDIFKKNMRVSPLRYRKDGAGPETP